ncbi:MAG TPA: hypothetical protein VFL68_10620, partial [Pseudolabrys sp.]|nr:hypothetical protein [Pseudolabrys sp.]
TGAATGGGAFVGMSAAAALPIKATEDTLAKRQTRKFSMRPTQINRCTLRAGGPVYLERNCNSPAPTLHPD